MMQRSVIEVADQFSRRRMVVFAAGALVFFIVQVAILPFMYAVHRGGIDWWLINLMFLLLCLATGGGQLNAREIRLLVNDEISRAHARSAAAAGYWTATGVALAIYVIPGAARLGARGAVWLLLTVSVTAALLMFCWLEQRAHRDG